MAGIDLERIDDYTYEIRRTNDTRMNVPGRVFSSPSLVKQLKNDQSLQQVVNVSMLPGIVGASMAHACLFVDLCSWLGQRDIFSE